MLFQAIDLQTLGGFGGPGLHVGTILVHLAVAFMEAATSCADGWWPESLAVGCSTGGLGWAGTHQLCG